MSDKVEKALAYNKKGYNCAQAVACTFCEELGIKEEDAFRMAEGFGSGMGMMDMCGAVTGMIMVIGMKNSIGNLESGKPTKGDTVKKAKNYAEQFKEKNGSYYCRDLKKVVDGKPMCSCRQCISDAVEMVENFLG
ncbi:MAG: C-GCAxxG-C-C family protein [Schaedlerella sp.]|nr:C-GCAxxG-C-C family protein [Schaedlerella sp.]